jgi:hypothetical protein
MYLTWSLLGIAELDPLQSSDVASDLLANLLFGIFLILGVVMLMNMMIALLSNTYQQIEVKRLKIPIRLRHEFQKKNKAESPTKKV